MGPSSGRLVKVIDDKLNLGASIVALERATAVPDLMAQPEFDELLGLYHRSQRELDVTCGRAKRFTICPASIAITLAQRETNKDLLVALGRKVRRCWSWWWSYSWLSFYRYVTLVCDRLWWWSYLGAVGGGQMSGPCLIA